MLNQDQLKAHDFVIRGRNVFVSGRAGTGKSFLINHIVDTLRSHGKVVNVTATTGKASFLIGGATVHWFFGIGTEEYTSVHRLASQIEKNPEAVARIKTCNVLIIDEASMLSRHLFEQLHYASCLIRETDANVAMGGIQMVFVGDILQLKPVARGCRGNDPKLQFFFQSPLFIQVFKTVTVKLTVNFRQQYDVNYQQLLDRISKGRCTSADYDLLRRKCVADDETKIPAHTTRLYGKNETVREFNNKKMNELEGASKMYKAKAFRIVRSQIIGEHGEIEDAPDVLLPIPFDHISKVESKLPVECCMHLKIGANISLTRNIDTSIGLVNGAYGVVVSMDSDCIGFRSNNSPAIHIIDYSAWNLSIPELGEIEYRQLPVRLAWAMTIHSAQGQTLPHVTTELVPYEIFAPGQAYVVMSRVASFDDLCLIDFNPASIMSDYDAVSFITQEGDEDEGENQMIIDELEMIEQSAAEEKLLLDELDKMERDATV